MSGPGRDFPDDKTAPERRKDLTEQEIKELKLAGGVEGGMEAGSGGGPAAPEEAERERRDKSQDNPGKIDWRRIRVTGEPHGAGTAMPG